MDNNKSLIKCTFCDHSYYKWAQSCPKCSGPNIKQRKFVINGCLCVLIIMLLLFSYLNFFGYLEHLNKGSLDDIAIENIEN